ncbi:hypothetical protein P171DRAFT_139516 [Karstenula rhodostoma CBS 690.94]|uniref:Uncharacterized protein n=1 Tax=Karstenula rhodostoma CBS 690.94 TaxID=1392251 RepID=A0A9P4PSA4_9PLEO|nr:hypothetical protein P171DRAFT_139516 [Karstenula rhodostoma CBS 690.94]
MSSDFVGLRVIWPPDGTPPPRHDQDIIFVHGLHHGSISQWRDKKGVCWPFEHLSLDLENARILAFGYDPTKLNVSSDGFYRGGLLFKQGEDLWSRLKTRRSPEKIQVPITLVGHDTGAIVIRSVSSMPNVRYNSAYGK